FSPTYWFFALGQFLIGIATTGIYTIGFVLGIELVGPKKRNFAGMVICIFYAMGYMLLAVIAFAVSGNWRQLEIILAVLTVPFFLYYWFANSFVYYGLSVNVTSLSDNPYASFFLYGAVEIPAYLLTWYLLDKVGRRLLICVFMVIGGLSLIIIAPVNNTSLDGLVSFLALFGKFCIAGSYAIVYILAAEIYPTPIRKNMKNTTANVKARTTVEIGVQVDIDEALIMDANDH
uniref:Solute carrier family 22 member 21-like n=1 Tax=Saccoglossus kowalevskii TaxID=10224 RepID=A0ABM0MNT3_SACKO